MNVPTFPVANATEDPLRPEARFWGPVRRYRGDTLLDVDAFDTTAETVAPQSCPVCAGGECKGVTIVYGYPIFECSKCGVGFVWPQPDATLLGEYYRRHYWESYLGESAPLYEREDIREHILRPQLKLAMRLLGRRSGARILDVGAGDGSMLRMFRDAGFNDARGLEFSDEVAEHAKRVNGVEVTAVPDFRRFEEDGFDLITLWAVIEHLPSPAEYVRHAGRLLRPGGWLLLMTGDNSSLFARIQGSFDMWMYPPEHLFFFDRRSLDALLEHGSFAERFVRMGFQGRLKESVLWALRLQAALRRHIAGQAVPDWRSTHSNLLAAGGRTPGLS